MGDGIDGNLITLDTIDERYGKFFGSRRRALREMREPIPGNCNRRLIVPAMPSLSLSAAWLDRYL
jgi:hypothetical protein